jgi:hypothetical protein
MTTSTEQDVFHKVMVPLSLQQTHILLIRYTIRLIFLSYRGDWPLYRFMFFLTPGRKELIIKELVVDRGDAAFGNNGTRQGGSQKYVHGEGSWEAGVREMYRILNRRGRGISDRKVEED